MAVTDFSSAPKKQTHVGLVKLLIEMGASPDFRFVCAATVGPNLAIVEALLEAGAEQNIFTAAALGAIDQLHRFLSADATLATQSTGHELLSETGMTALHYACRSELGKLTRFHADRLALCVSCLLDHRPQYDRETDGAFTPLDLCASRGGNVRIATRLLAHGWRATSMTLLMALGHFQRHGRGNYDVAALCLDSGVDINSPLGGRTLLHALAHHGDLVGTRWLLDHGAMVDSRDHGNNKPLHKVCERNTGLGVAQLLVERGASLTTLNNNGETALDVAIGNDKKRLEDYLRSVGALAVAKK